MDRAKEIAALEDLLGRLRSGHGQALVVRGEPGIGKTALLGHVAGAAERMRLLRTAGVEPETDIGYASLHRLVLPVLGAVDEIPRPQARALEIALGRADGPVPDRLLVALATLSLLAEVAVDGPVLCLVDDAQWVDRASLDVLAFVGRRLDAEPVGLVFASRPDTESERALAGVSELRLTGLDEGTAGEFLDGRWRLTPAERRQVLALAGGNPLALRELPDALRHGGRALEPLPLTVRLRDAFLHQVRRRDAATQRLLLVIAAEGSGRLSVVRAAAESVGATVQSLDEGALEDLVSQEGERLTFRHPLIRAAVYHGASPGARRAVHRALAAALHEEPSAFHRYAWHLGQAAEGADEEVAGHLERSAQRASLRTGYAAASAALSRAAQLSASEDSQGRRLVAAAAVSWQGGDIDRARELLDEAERIDRLPDRTRLDLAELRARLALLAGTPADGVAPLRAVLPDALRADAEHAMPSVMTYGEIGYRASLAHVAVEVADWLDDVALEGDTPDAALHRLVRAGNRARVGRDPGLRPGDLDAIERLTDPVTLTRAAGLTWAVGAYELGTRLRRKAVERARATGAAGALAWSLEHLVFEELTHSRFGAAEAYADEGHQLAVEAGQPNTACRYLSLRVWAAALQGRADEARRWAQDVVAVASRRQLGECLAYVHLALGHLDLVDGAYSEAVCHYEATEPRAGAPLRSGPAFYGMAELIEALVRADQHARAVELAPRFTIWTDRTASPLLQALTARCRALLASGDEAERQYQRSLQHHALADAPMEQARTELLYGQHLRRVRRHSDARTHLHAAAETFRRIEAHAWAKRAQDELRAAGGAGPTDERPVLSALTPQERRVALAISEGRTNREVAAELFLSPRTVDYHLRKIFQKTGIRSRAELVRLVLTVSRGP